MNEQKYRIHVTRQIPPNNKDAMDKYYDTLQQALFDIGLYRHAQILWDQEVQETTTDFYEKNNVLTANTLTVSGGNYADTLMDFEIFDPKGKSVTITWQDVVEVFEAENGPQKYEEICREEENGEKDL